MESAQALLLRCLLFGGGGCFFFFVVTTNAELAGGDGQKYTKALVVVLSYMDGRELS